MANFTLDDLMQFTRNEKKMVEEMLPMSVEDKELLPSEDTIQRILSYSRSLSVRPSKKLGSMSMMLN